RSEGGHHIIERLITETKVFAQAKSFSSTDRVDRQCHVIDDFGGLPGPRVSGVDNLSAHNLKQWLGLVEGFLASTDHKGQSPFGGTSSPSRDRRVQSQMASFVRQLCRLYGIVNGNRR